MKLVAMLVAVLTTLSVPAWAGPSEERLERLLDAFEDSALWVGNYHENGAVLARWTKPIRVSMTGNATEEFQGLVVETLTRLAAISHASIEILPSGSDEGDYVIFFANNDVIYARDGARGACLSQNNWDGGGSMTRVKLTINAWAPDRLKLERCVRHEALHGMGLLGHPHQLDSILSYVYHRDDYTEDDVLLLELLYALKPGMYHFHALAAAREELGRRLGLAPEVAAALGAKVFEKELKRATEAAESGHALMQVQLGAAYATGHYVDKQPERAVELFRKAAEQGNSDAQFRLAHALASGNGVAKDVVEAARLYERAARKGHSMARNNLGLFYRDGKAGPADPVAAWALFDLAAERGNAKAAEHRDALALSEARKELARQRKAEWSEAAK